MNGQYESKNNPDIGSIYPKMTSEKTFRGPILTPFCFVFRHSHLLVIPYIRVITAEPRHNNFLQKHYERKRFLEFHHRRFRAHSKKNEEKGDENQEGFNRKQKWRLVVFCSYYDV